ncbi:MAG: PLP-dependent aminotransferase family protein [Pseudomonadota bacterium]
MTADTSFRYVTLADSMETGILKGHFRAGEKLPSLRSIHRQMGLSISTVYQAYIELEKRGHIESREKSGFFVKAKQAHGLGTLSRGNVKVSPQKITVNVLAESILAALQDPAMLQLGAALPDREHMPLKQLSRLMKSLPSQTLGSIIATYEPCQGNLALRQAVAGRSLGHGLAITAEDVVTTGGCMEAVGLCLKAVTRPGDTVLVESPAFHGFLQLMEDLNLMVLEMPCDPDRGIDPKALETILDTHQVNACLFNASFQNPLGCLTSDPDKKAIVHLLALRGIPLIEDDIYGDLYFGNRRPATFKHFDAQGMVLLCSSVSKTLAPGFRVGWTIPGKFREKLLRLKLNTCLASPAINQAVTAQFLKSGAYDRHLRRLRSQLKNQVSAMALAVSNYFPGDTKMSHPKGGLFLWIQLGPGVDSMAVYRKAFQAKISVLPGIICSSTDRYANCIRINCGITWNPRVEAGIRTLGRIVREASNP